MSTTTDTFRRFLDVLAESLDDRGASGDALASRMHLSRFHAAAVARGPRVFAARCSSGVPLVDPPGGLRVARPNERSSCHWICCIRTWSSTTSGSSARC